MQQSDIQRPYLTINNKLMGVGALGDGPSKDGDYQRGYLCGMIRGNGSMGVYPYLRSNGRESVLYRFGLALCDGEAVLRSYEYLQEHGIETRGFLFQEASGPRRAMRAIRASDVATFDSIHSLVAWPNALSRSWAAGFLAGIFDAEGSYSQCVLRISNTDPEIIHWIRSCLDALHFRYAVERKTRDGAKPLDVVRLKGGLREQLRFFHSVDPAITRKLSIEGQAVKSDARLRVVEIAPLGKALRLFDIKTETGDFIANGVVSHNCFARPSHAYRNLSPGIDFETRIFAKANAAELLRKELSRPAYRCEELVIGVNTDAYQPIERELRITRSVLEVCAEFNQPVSLITKNATVERDIDILAPMAAQNLVAVTISCNNLDHEIARRLEPRCVAPRRRLEVMRNLSAAGIPVSVLVAPVIPFLTDDQIEPVLEAAWEHGARQAGYVLLRLPWEVKDLFKDWLERHYPLKAKHIMSRVQAMRGGRDNDPRFGSRMVGDGTLAELLRKRFAIASKRLGFNERHRELDTSSFRVPRAPGQLTLF
jgi:DNA repair photolyase